MSASPRKPVAPSFLPGHEASQDGSPVIDSEHMLIRYHARGQRRCCCIGSSDRSTSRNDSVRRLRNSLLAANASLHLQKYRLPRARERSYSLSPPKKRDKLGHAYIGTEHLLLSVLRQKNSLGATLLASLSGNLEAIRKESRRKTSTRAFRLRASRPCLHCYPEVFALFLDALREGPALAVIRFFDEHSQLIDASGKRWAGRDQIEGTKRSAFRSLCKEECRLSTRRNNRQPSWHETSAGSLGVRIGLWRAQQFYAAHVYRSRPYTRSLANRPRAADTLLASSHTLTLELPHK